MYQPLAHSNPTCNPPEYEVEKIVAARVTWGVQQYYVKWIGYAPYKYAPRHNSWEDEEVLSHAQDILGDFLSIIPDPSPPYTQCQAKLYSGAAELSRISKM